MRARVSTPHGNVSTTVDGAGGPGRRVVVLAHGAGTDMHHASLAMLAADLARADHDVVRFNFPYREGGKRFPNRLPVLVDCYRAVLDAVMTDLSPAAVVLAGRSLGGRVASHLALERSDVVGLCFLSFPLHPATTPGTSRAEHLPTLALPMLFVQGTRDALATWSLFTPMVGALPDATLHVVEQGDHSLMVPKRTAAPDAVRAGIRDAIVAWLERVTATATQPASR